MSSSHPYFIDAEEPMGRCLALCEEWSTDFATVIEREDIRCLRLSLSNGWRADHLNFLEEVPRSVTGFQIFSWRIHDLTPVIARSGVEHLAFQVELRKAVNLRELAGSLKTLQLVYSGKTKHLEACANLRVLNVVAYPDGDMTLISALHRLQSLHVVSNRLKSCKGIEGLQGLSVLDVADCPKLTSLEGIDCLGELEEVTISGCPNVEAIPKLSGLQRLRSLIIEDCGMLPSIEFLENSGSLERVLIIGSTQIGDGNLLPLRSLPQLREVRVADGPYNITNDELRALLRQ